MGLVFAEGIQAVASRLPPGSGGKVSERRRRRGSVGDYMEEIALELAGGGAIVDLMGIRDRVAAGAGGWSRCCRTPSRSAVIRLPVLGRDVYFDIIPVLRIMVRKCL